MTNPLLLAQHFNNAAIISSIMDTSAVGVVRIFSKGDFPLNVPACFAPARRVFDKMPPIVRLSTFTPRPSAKADGFWHILKWQRIGSSIVPIPLGVELVLVHPISEVQLPIHLWCCTRGDSDQSIAHVGRVGKVLILSQGLAPTLIRTLRMLRSQRLSFCSALCEFGSM